MLQPLVRRTWAMRGQTPVLHQWDRRDRVSALAALALSPQRRRLRLFFRLLDHNATAEDFVWFLNDLRLELGRKLHVVWDNLGAHRKAENFFTTIDCRWVRFHRLPPYAPELNPVEHVWSTGKWGPLANAPPHDVRQLQTNLDAELARQAREQQLLRAHLRWAGLDLS
jgi:hypothetical protein